MRKNSTRAQRIHVLVHQMLQAIIVGDRRTLERSYNDAFCIDRHDRAHGGSGYNMLWFVQIAQQYPAALQARPDLAQWVQDFHIDRRAFIRGKRDYTVGYVGNPYCAYTGQSAYEAWEAGWQEAAKDDYSDDEDIDD